MKRLLSFTIGLAALCVPALSSSAADLDENRGRIEVLNAELSKQVEEISTKFAGLAHPQSLQDAEVLAFNDWIDEKIAELQRLHEELIPEFGRLERSLREEGLPAVALERHQEMLAQYQARYSAFSELIDTLEKLDHRMRPRGQGVHSRADSKQEERIRENLAARIKEIRDFVENSKPPKPKTFQLPPWQNIKMKTREPKSGGEGISPAYLEPLAASSREAATGEGLAAATLPAAVVVQASDSAQTVDTEPNQKVRDLATSLDHDPIRMYEWVLNNVAYQPYYGSAKGAVKTYYDRAGNDFDAASLLISLLRESGIPARYVYGSVSLTPAQANNLFGTDSAVTAASILAGGGIPVRWDGFSLLVEHCWLEAYVPYDSYRGTRSLPGGNAWVPLDPSFKIYDYQPGLQVAKDVPMDWKSFFENGVTEKTAVELWKEKIAEQLASTQPGAVIDDVPWKRTIRAEHLGALPLSLKVEVKEVHWEAPEIADALRHKIQFKYFETNTPDWSAPTELDVTLPLSRILAGRITLNWLPATPEDAAIIDRFEGLHRTPSYLVKVKAAVLLEGEVLDSGLAVAIGSSGYLREYAILPTGVQGATDDFGNLYQVVKKQVSCPSIYGLGFGFQGYAEEYVQERIARLQAHRESHSYDDVYGEIAYLNAITWYQRVYDSDSEVAALRHFTNYPSQVAMGFSLLGAEVQGMMGGMGAVSAMAQSLSLDMVMIWTMTPLHLEQVEEEATKIMGASDSQLEHMVLEDYYAVPAVSAVKLIQQAYVDNVPVRNGWTDPYQGSHIFMDEDVRIFNYVGRGRIEGGYFISGGLSGGSFAAYIGVSIKTGSQFVFPAGKPLAFEVSLSALVPYDIIKYDSFTSVKVTRGSTDLTSNFTYNVTWVGWEYVGTGKNQKKYSMYHFDLVTTDWSIVIPGNYTLALTMKKYYWVGNTHTASIPFNVYSSTKQTDPITLKDGAGATVPIDYTNGWAWLTAGETVCFSNVSEYWIYGTDGSLLMHGLNSGCFKPTASGTYKLFYTYLQGGNLYYAILELEFFSASIEQVCSADQAAAAPTMSSIMFQSAAAPAASTGQCSIGMPAYWPAGKRMTIIAQVSPVGKAVYKWRNPDSHGTFSAVPGHGQNDTATADQIYFTPTPDYAGGIEIQLTYGTSTAAKNVTAVKVGLLQVKVGTAVEWHNFAKPQRILLDKEAHFRATELWPSGVVLPSWIPTWEGTFGVASSGVEVSHKYLGLASASDSDTKTVLTNCGPATGEAILVCKTVLGIHSNVDSSAGFTAGHAWITATDHSLQPPVSVSYGLWPDEHPSVVNNGPGSDVRVGMEPSSGRHNRYYLLAPSEVGALNTFISAVADWTYLYTCANWAESAVKAATGETVDSGDMVLFGTPRAISESIQEQEGAHPTAPDMPLNGGEDASSTSTGSSWDGSSFF